jgi:LacI family transcriptional regulator
VPRARGLTTRQGTRTRVTLREVAAAANVDPSAVSRVVNNDPRVSVSKATRQRILDAVARLGYRPSIGARGLRTAKTWTIGFVLPSLSNPMYEPIVRGVEMEAQEHGYGIVLGSQIEGRSPEMFANLLQEGRVDGLLVASSTLHDDFIREIIEHGPGPVVPVNRRVEGVKSSVVVDDEAASAKAVSYLASLGHRFLGGIFGPQEIDTAVRRKKGFASAIAAAGLEAAEVDRPGWGPQHGYLGANQMLTENPEVTAIYASTLLMGIGALRAAAERGRAVPTDLSVICLHDSPIAEYLVPPLTTVRLPTEELGRRAVQLLIERAEGGPERAVLIEGDGEIMERASTGPAPQNRPTRGRRADRQTTPKSLGLGPTSSER